MCCSTGTRYRSPNKLLYLLPVRLHFAWFGGLLKRIYSKLLTLVHSLLYILLGYCSRVSNEIGSHSTKELFLAMKISIFKPSSQRIVGRLKEGSHRCTNAFDGIIYLFSIRRHAHAFCLCAKIAAAVINFLARLSCYFN